MFDGLGGVPIGAPPSHLSDDDEALKALRGFVPSPVWRDPLSTFAGSDDLPTGYIPASDISVFGTGWSHNQGSGGAPFGPPGYPALDTPNGLGNYAACDGTVATTDIFNYGSGKYVGPTVTPLAIAPSATGFKARVLLGNLFLTCAAGETFLVDCVDSAGNRYSSAAVDCTTLPVGGFVMFSLTMALIGPGDPQINSIRITCVKPLAAPGHFLMCSFAEIKTA